MAVPQDARHIANQAGDFVPQHGNSWVLEVAGLDGDDKDLILLSLESLTLPAEESEDNEIRYGNEKRYVAGANTYDETTLVLKDWVDRKTRRALVEWRRLVYDPATGNVGLPANYKRTATVILQDTSGGQTRTCRYIGIWPRRLEGGELSMESSDQVKISVTFRYDRIEWTL